MIIKNWELVLLEEIMSNFAEREPGNIQNEAAGFEFEQKLDAIGMDQKMIGQVGRNIEHYRQFIANTFDSDEREKINETLLQMIELHKDQKDRPDGMPYISHPLEVSRMMVEDFGIRDIELIEASLLHDAVEDQGLKLAKTELEAKYGAAIRSDDFEEEHKDEIRALALSEIAEKYGDRVAGIVDKLSSPDFDRIARQDIDPTDKVKLQARKHELYKEHVTKSVQDPDVLVIKLADFLHNTSDAGQLPESSQKEKYRNKYVPVMPVFRDRLLDESKPIPIPNRDLIIHRLEEVANRLANR